MWWLRFCFVSAQEKETKTPVSVKSVKKEVTALANDVKDAATPVVEAVVKRVSLSSSVQDASRLDSLKISSA